MERHFNNFPQFPAAADGYAVFGNAPGHAYDIDLLERIVADQAKRHLPGKADQRDIVVMRVRKPRNRIGSPRAACYKADADLPGGFGVALRLVYQRLFVARKHQPDILLLV